MPSGLSGQRLSSGSFRAPSARSVGNTLLYRRTRRLVRDAEALTTQTDKAARWLSRRTVIAPVTSRGDDSFHGRRAGRGASRTCNPPTPTRWFERASSKCIAAIQPLQRQLEEWFISRSPTDAPTIDMADAQPGAESLEKVSVSLTNGRVRLALGSSIPELSGRSILLAPAIDRQSASPLDLHSGRHSCAIPAGGVQAGLTHAGRSRNHCVSHARRLSARLRYPIFLHVPRNEPSARAKFV